MNRYRHRFPGLLGETLDEIGALAEQNRVESSDTVRVQERSTQGTKLEVTPPTPVEAPPREMWFQVREVLHDYILCHPLDSRLWVEYNIAPASYILVAKPNVLRTWWLSSGSGSQGGFTFEQFDSEPKQHRYRQHPSYLPERDVEEIYPLYSVGDLILALEIKDTPPVEWSLLATDIYTALGLVTPADITPSSAPTDTIPAGTQVLWLDRNEDTRRWASLGLLTGDRVASDGTDSLRVIGYEI